MKKPKKTNIKPIYLPDPAKLGIKFGPDPTDAGKSKLLRDLERRMIKEFCK